MRRILVSFFALVTAVSFINCSDGDRIDQKDGSIPAPAPVEVVSVTPTSGGAVLKVKIPDDDNLKGVVAVYNRNGQEVDNKISRFVDTLVVEGYADTDPHEVKVYAFNVNEKRSEPVTLTINPLAPAVQTVKLSMLETFGGIKIHVEDNKDRADLAVCLLADDDADDTSTDPSKRKWTEIQTMFTSSPDVFLSRRNLDPKKTVFGVYIRDHWGNVSDTLMTTLTPWYEEKLDTKYFKDASLADDNSFSTNASAYPLRKLWDGSGSSATPFYFYASSSSCPMPQWFTIDLCSNEPAGSTAGVRLSRIGKYARIDYLIWQDAHPREYEFWGSMNPTGEVNPDNEHGFDDSWVKLGYYEQPKPSGYNSDGTVGTVTPEDREYFNTGTEFEMDDTKYPHAFDKIRYLRVVIVNTFGTYETHNKQGQVQLGEIIPYGQYVK